ncbi:efflux transporter, outer membrane factor (OMF) lipoprotein, NodT family [Maridesulfovibrio ferrireducens]|uniref:Efflux transporter, outer membrane factor (OMF) lipoprotein, NodT family n=2 Tax=Maridesulfovibrio ferrireducens TaxID=246191 RepID=A0A1G9J5X6_9BACT|nr:efflux transporter, outer membrane factor (OMF) lipoprotein, NodT family [Maridesulfovibrio ferrireducens]
MPSYKYKLLIYSLIVVFGLSACSPFRPAPRDGVTMGLPLSYTLYSSEPQEFGKWWESFGSAELNRMVEEALTADFDVRIAWAKLRQLRASAIKSGAAKYPTLDGFGKYTGSKTGSDGTEGTKGSTSTDKHELGLTASYEIDVWGKIEAKANSGELDFLVSREDVSSAAMTVASEVVSRWLEIQTQRQKKAILFQQLETNTIYQDLVELRFRNSLANALDVYQQRENVARVKALIPPVESRERILLNELALLLGRPAGTVEILTTDFPALDPVPGLGLPFDLLANRPDVRSAGLKLQSSDWAVAAARADRLPSFNLTGNAALTSAQIANIFSGWMVGLAASIAGPIFDGGYRAAEVDRTRAVVDERLLNYKRTVYIAYKEVQDSLIKETWQQEYITARKNQLDAAKTNLNEAGSRYLQGLEEYLPVLSALLSVQSLEINIVEDESNLLLYRVSLYRALGGNWTDSLTSADELSETSVKADAEIKTVSTK